MMRLIIGRDYTGRKCEVFLCGENHDDVFLKSVVKIVSVNQTLKVQSVTTDARHSR